MATAPKKSGETVTVMCKLPHGLRLRGYKMREGNEPVMGGGSRAVKVAEPTGEEHIVYGVATPYGKRAATIITPSGYAVTTGVPKDLWDAWLEDNKTSSMVRNQLVFAEKSEASGVDRAKDLAGQRSGMEPFAQEGDPRAPRAPAGMTSPKPADEQPKAA